MNTYYCMIYEKKGLKNYYVAKFRTKKSWLSGKIIILKIRKIIVIKHL